jgi:hypothetical protein
LRILELDNRKKASITINVDNVVFFGVVGVAFVVIALVVKFLFF